MIYSTPFTIKIPRKVASDYSGYTKLISIYHEVRALTDRQVVFDFSDNAWFEANLVAVFGAICDSLFNKGNQIEINPEDFKAKSILERNGFLEYFGRSRTRDFFGTTIPFQEFTTQEGDRFSQYIKNELLSKPDFPSVSQLVSKRMNQSIFEIFENARTHGACEKIYTCGQYFPGKHPPRIDTTIVDLGVSIKKNVNDYMTYIGLQELSGSDAIEWAVKEGNTTKTGKISGGLGLGMVLKFLELNKGKIQIVSSKGYWELRKGNKTKSEFSKVFLGTIVNIEVNIDDRNHYLLEKEVPFDDIF